MGKTKDVDMSVQEETPVEEVKETRRPKRGDALIESLKAELGEVEAKPKKKDVILEGAERPMRPKASPPSVIESEPEKDSIASLQSDKQEEPKKEVVHPKVGKQKPRSKKYQAAAKLINPEEHYRIPEAVDLAKSASYSKYDGTLEIHINTAIKNLKGSVSLPFASAKKVTILAFGKGAEGSGADLVGDDKKLDEISKGKVDFDILVTTPEWMPKLASLAKVLGPKGLMPNPKNNTIGNDLKKLIVEHQTGKMEYKTEANGKVMHLSLGKVSQPSEELTQNVKILLQTIGKSKIKKAVLSPTLGPGIKLDTTSI